MTITIPDDMANKIVVAFGRTVATTMFEKNSPEIKRDAAEFIKTLPPNYQESCYWLLNETINIWAPGSRRIKLSNQAYAMRRQ